MICYLDLDGVLVDFVSGACKLHNVPYPYHDPQHRGKWWFNKIYDIDHNVFFNGMGEEFWSNLDWLPDGKEILQIVTSHFENVHIMTSPCKTKGCKEGKQNWVKKHIPEFENRLIIDDNKDKYAGPNKLLIDDADHNVRKFAVAGGNAILLPRLWNSYHPYAPNVIAYLKECLKNVK